MNVNQDAGIVSRAPLASASSSQSAGVAQSDAQRFEQLLARNDAKGLDAPHAPEHQGKDAAQAHARFSREDHDNERLHAQLDAAVFAATCEAARAQEIATPASVAPPQLDELIARYVQQLAVTETAAEDARVMLKLDPALLPDTELFLMKSANGWVLQANARSAEALRVLSEHGPALERRFARRHLGALNIEIMPR
jgi:hypothetical protein